MALVMNKDDLELLLRLTQRTQTINGKTNSQVHSCILIAHEGRVHTHSLVKDGVSSVSKFSIPYRAGNAPRIETYPVPNIDHLLGVLKYHGKKVYLKHIDNKLRVETGSKKRTTISANPKALAFPYSPDNMEQWDAKSQSILDKISVDDLTYEKAEGGHISPISSYVEVNPTELYEAVRCGNMNGQKEGRYTIHQRNGELRITTGKEFAGKTSYILYDEINPTIPEFSATFEGGLEHTMKLIDYPIDIHFFDFTEYKQGYKMLIDLGDGDLIFQSSVVEA